MYRLHPVTKVVIVIASIIVASICPLVCLIAFLTFVASLSAVGMEFAKFLRIMRSALTIILVLALFTLLYGVLSTHSPRIILEASFTQGVIIGSIKLLKLMLSFAVLFSTTRPQSIVRMLSKLRVPYKYTYILVLAIRYMSILMSDFQEIYDVQAIRGLRIDSGSTLMRIRNTLSLFIPLIVASTDRLNDMSIVLEVKGFGLSKHRSYAFVEKVNLMDVAVIALIPLVVIGPHLALNLVK
ncbi:MAG: energy-coupling factor transporter transmembrane protein EcfT [Sulfolobales archaeon]|nr:energy-coupling factor transporter transmembrane protein EcfT [Sulfolobales archaeon]